MNVLSLPTRSRGRQSPEAVERFEQERAAFCARIRQIASTLDFNVSSRGWCYLLEEYGLTKGDFDRAQTFINDCRKDGLLPLDICAEDGARATDGIPEKSDTETPEEFAEWLAQYQIGRLADWYQPRNFWEDREVYVEMLVEKKDLKGVFGPVCEEYFVPLSNVRGWADINSRAALIGRLQEQHCNGNRCVILYCGDHDPGGLSISDTLIDNLRQLEGATGAIPPVEIVRFGLNYDFIQAQGLTWVDNLETSSGKRLDDPKYSDFRKPYVQAYLSEYGARKVEANALVTRIDAGRKLCREAIEQWVSPADVADYKNFLMYERSQVRAALPSAIAEIWGEA